MSKQSHPRQEIRAARPRPRRSSAQSSPLARPLPRWLALDLLVCLCLALPWLGLVGYVAATPPTRVAFGVADAPANVVFLNFYGVERNAGGAFRWAKPGASISVPVSAPATYAITLTMQDSPAVPAPRVVTVYANGRAIGTAALGTAPQEYHFAVPFSVGDWSGDSGRTLNIETDVAPFVPPGDPRPLGPIVARVVVAPGGGSVTWPLALGAALALLAGGYAFLRLLGLRPAFAAGFVALGVASYALVAFGDRSAALALTFRPITQPLAFVSLLSALVGLPLLGGAGAARFAGTAPSQARAGLRGWRLTREQSAVLATLAGIMALGLGLRLYHLHHLSFWLDETATIYFSRRPWPFVLGLEGSYDTHPPLYYALVKLARLFAPDVSAGRLTSVVAGVMTLPVLAALVARLSNWRAGLVAALVLAVSPLHVWYSQEARMYTPVVLLLALSYLALVAFAQTTARHWAVMYGVSVVLALYVDYSAVYALAPQVVALGLITWRWRRAALPLWGCALGAVCCYLPWVPSILNSIEDEGRNRESFLGATSDKVASVALSVVGLKNKGNYLWGPIRTAWERTPALLVLFLIGMVAAALLGAVLLARRSPLGVAVALGLLLGTFVVAVLVSLVSPGFAERTVLAAALGWALLLGVAACTTWGTAAPPRRLPRWYNAVAIVGLVLTLVASAGSLRATYAGASKENNRALAAAAAQGARDGVPVLVDGWLEAATTAYHPDLAIGAETTAVAGGQFWWAYGDYAWADADARSAGYERLGFVRLMHRQYDVALYLDYFARPGTLPPGATPLAVDAPGRDWQLSPGASRDVSGAVLLAGEGMATLNLPDVREGFYLLAVEMGGAGQGRAMLGCLGAGNALLATFPAVEAVPGELWLAALCPSETAAVAIVLRGEKPGSAEFRGLRLWDVPEAAGR